MARGLGGDDVYAQAVLEYLLDPGGHQCHKPHATAQALREALMEKKTVKKGDIVPFWRPPPPKRVKRGHLLSDYRQKCVNETGDSYCGVKSPFLSDLRIR